MPKYKPQKKPHKRKRSIPKGYDSLFEYDLHRGTLRHWQHHDGFIKYFIEKTYYPDYFREIDGKKIYIEAKGRFRDRPEATKYIWVREQLKDDEELVFLFANPFTPMPGARKRSDGSKQTHADWAKKNKFRWFVEQNIPDNWRKK